MADTGRAPLTLYLLTHAFPFGQTEPFLETELPIVASAFRRVVVIPSHCDGVQRAVPENVAVEHGYAALRQGRARRLLRAALHGVASPACWREFCRHRRMLRSPQALLKIAGTYRDAVLLRDWLQAYMAQANETPSQALLYAYWFDYLALGAGMCKARHPQLPVVARAHGLDLYEEAHHPAMIPFRAAMAQSVDHLFVCSQDGADYARRRYDLAGRCSVARLGVDDPGVHTPSSCDGTLRVLSCAFLQPYKRIPLLVRALRALADRCPQQRIQWDHLGDGPERPHIERLAQQLLPPTVVWRIHGLLSRADIETFYRTHAVDVFVTVSETEGAPVTVMEAQSHGIPVVAAAAGGTRELVTNENGILLPLHPTADDIAQALSAFAPTHLPAASARKRQASRDTWQQHAQAAENYHAFAHALISLAEQSYPV